MWEGSAALYMSVPSYLRNRYISPVMQISPTDKTPSPHAATAATAARLYVDYDQLCLSPPPVAVTINARFQSRLLCTSENADIFATDLRAAHSFESIWGLPCPAIFAFGNSFRDPHKDTQEVLCMRV